MDETKTKLASIPGKLDFKHHSPEATNTINSWVSDKTRGKVKNLIPPGSLTQSTRLVLTNAIYFKSAWMHPFRLSDTYDDDFVLTSGRKARVPFMHERKHLDYAENPQVQLIRLPYADHKTAMLVVLPKAGVTLGDIEKDLSIAKLSEWTQALSSHEIRVSLPRFRFDASFRLNDALKAIGMIRAFAPDQADFSGIDGSKSLSIDQVFHKAFLGVDEAGTEAAAATAITMFGAAMENTKPIEFNATRPFLFLIQDVQSETILFMGRLENPRG